MRGLRTHVSAIALAFACATSLTAIGQGGQPPKSETKVLLSNERVEVTETRYKPGAENSNVPRAARVIRALTSGTLQRIYPDGRKENLEWKAGEVRFNPALEGATPQYTTKNVGKSELVLYSVRLK
jgi:hypothetical protein